MKLDLPSLSAMPARVGAAIADSMSALTPSLRHTRTRMIALGMAAMTLESGCFPRVDPGEGEKTTDTNDGVYTEPFDDTGGDTGGSDSDTDVGDQPDSDDDGLTDAYEANYDRDGDGEPEECLDPESADTDGDGMPDGEEIGDHTDPCDSDTDDDGYTDGEEHDAGSDPLDAEDPGTDSDGDGLSDQEEAALGTNATDADSDDDCHGDGDEDAAGTDPLDINSPENPELSSTTTYATVYHDVDGNGVFSCLSYGSGTNVALGQDVTANIGGDTNVCSSTDQPAGCWPANLTDGDTGTLAFPGDASFDYAVDLGSAHSLESVLAYWGYYGSTAGYIDSWTLSATLDDDTQVTLATESSNPGANQTLVVLSDSAHGFPIEELRVYSFYNPNYVGLYELEAYQN
jgi:hypothetical protein